MHIYRFVFRYPASERNFYCDFLAKTKKDAMKEWTSFKKTESDKITLTDIIKKDRKD